MHSIFDAINAKPTISWLNEQKNNQINQENIFEIFLNKDLRFTSEPALDPNYFYNEDYTFESDILVQIDEVVDISLPFEKRNDFMVNNKEEKRTLKLLLSDGFYQISAITKTILKNFDPRMVPGIKMKILKGSKVKYGVLFLDETKIEIIGGQSNELKDKRDSIVIYDECKYRESKRKSTNESEQFLEGNEQIKKTKKTKLKTNSLNDTNDVNAKKQKKPRKKKALELEINTSIGNQEFSDSLNLSKSNLLSDIKMPNSVNYPKPILPSDIKMPDSINSPKPSLPSDKKTTDSINLLNPKISAQKTTDSNNGRFTYLEGSSDDVIENEQSPPSVSTNSILDQISSSTCSSDVEIIKSINEKYEKEQLMKNQTNSQSRKFLSDDDDDDFDFYLYENSNLGKSATQSSTEPFSLIQNSNLAQTFSNSILNKTVSEEDSNKMKIWTLTELLKRDNKKSPKLALDGTEVILLDAKIVKINELKIIKKKGSIEMFNLLFSMDCKVASGQNTMAMKVASKVIEKLLDSSPEAWLELEFNEQISRYENCSKSLTSFKSPLNVLHNLSQNKNNYFIVTNDFLIDK